MNKTIAYNSHFNYGSGADSSAEDIRGLAVVPTEPKNLKGASGADVTYMTHIVESQRQLEESLKVSAAMSLNYGFVAGGSAKVDFAQSNALNEYSLSVIVSVEVKNPVLLMSDVKLTPEAKDLYTRSPDSFKERYGDCYVGGIHTGGEMFGMIVIRTKSASQKSSLAMSLHASGNFGLASASLDASMQQNVSEATKDSDTSVFIHTSGYTFDKYPQTVEDLLTCAAQFPAGVKNTGQGTPYAMDLMEYKYLDLPPGPNLYDLQNRDEVIQFCAQLKSDAMSKRATIRFIRGNPHMFPTANQDDLSKYESELATLLDNIHGRMSTCFNDWRQCSFERGNLVLPVTNLPDPVEPQASPIAAKYAQTGGKYGFLGLPQDGGELPCMDGKGKYQRFQQGAIFWHPDIGAFEVHGMIYLRYQALNCEQGALGYPTSDERSMTNSVDRYSLFQHGSIHWDHATNVAKESGPIQMFPGVIRLFGKK